MTISYSALKEVERSAYKTAILLALQFKPVYAGTVTAKVKAKRRAANKMARISRRRNR